MPVYFVNNANGAPAGADVNYFNCGEESGSTWNYFFKSSGSDATMQYAIAPRRSTVCYKFTTGAIPAQIFMINSNIPVFSTYYIRCSIFLPALPPSSMRVSEIVDESSSVCVSVGIRTDGQIVIRDNTTAQMLQSTTRVATNQWVRFELKVVGSPTAGQVEMRYYKEADSPYPTETMVSAASYNTMPGAAPPGYPRFGFCGFGLTNFSYYVDDIAYSDSGWIGPADSAYQSPLLLSNNAEMGVIGQTVTAVAQTLDATNEPLTRITGGSTISFSTVQKSHGTMSYYFQPVDGTSSTLTFTSLATNSGALRCYAYFTGLPTGAVEIAQLTTNGGGGSYYTMARIILTPAGRISAYDVGGSIWTSTGSISVNTWYRFEIYGVVGSTTSNGVLQLAFYNHDNTTAIESFATSTANLGTVQTIGYALFGKLNVSGLTSPFYMDCLAVQQKATGFIGPYTGPMTARPSFPGIVPYVGWGRKL